MRRLVACVVAVLVGLSSAFPLRAADADVIAKGEGVQVTREQLDEAFINLRAAMAAQGRKIAEAQRPALERQLLEKLVMTQLLLKKATEADRETASNKVAKLVDEQRARARSEARFEAQIRAAGMAPETFHRQLLERGICEEVLDRELRPQLGVSAEKVRAFYDAHPDEFRRPERVRLQQVVITARTPSGAELPPAEKAEKRQVADRLAERIRKGEDLGAIAAEFSDDPGGRDRRGEYVFPVGRMVEELEVALRTLNTNEVSGVIATPYGFHIVKLLERLPGEVAPFDSIAEPLKARLELEATQALLPQYQERLFKEARVEFLTQP